MLYLNAFAELGSFLLQKQQKATRSPDSILLEHINRPERDCAF